eukprot:jgi/Mesvir1/21433/Mv20903-RA.1
MASLSLPAASSVVKTTSFSNTVARRGPQRVLASKPVANPQRLASSFLGKNLSWNPLGARAEPMRSSSGPTIASVAEQPPKTTAPPPPPPPTDDGLVQEKLSQSFRRTVYDANSWRKHRSTSRYSRNMTTIIGSRIVRALIPPMLWCGGVAVAIGLYEDALTAGDLPTMLPHLAPTTTSPLALSSFVLSLLLVFRTNSSYNRWDEARKMWGLMTNRSRDIVRQGVTWFDADEKGDELVEGLAKWMSALTRSLKAHLRAGEDLDDDLRKLLTPKEFQMLSDAKHRPNYCLQVMAGIIRKANLTPMQTTAMDLNLTAFADVVGGCERILKTPIPLSYTRHTSRFLIVWATALPIGLWHQLHWSTPVVTMVMTFFLLGIEEIGVQIEEPFSILPLEAMCAGIHGGLQEMRQLRNKSEAYVSNYTSSSE